MCVSLENVTAKLQFEQGAEGLGGWERGGECVCVMVEGCTQGVGGVGVERKTEDH